MRSASFLASCAVHAVLLFGAAGVIASPVRTGVESGWGGMEICLVAAPRWVEGGAEMRGEGRERSQGIPAPRPGDGSSSTPGTDRTTLYLPGGAQVDADGAQFRNPAPAYPLAAVRLGQEGRVVLEVSVDEAGRPMKVELRQSSGFPLLDQSALKTVRSWKFPVRSQVRVPIRFALKE